MTQQKRLRKVVALTEAQSRKLYELSAFDGLDPLEHARRAIDEYLSKQNTNLHPLFKKEVTTKFKSFNSDPKVPGAFWISGIVDQYEFSAFFLKSPSKSSIDKGKISKLSIWDPVVYKSTNNFIGSCIVNYDRGWDIRPSIIALRYYDKVKALLDGFAEQYTKENL